MDLCYGLSSSSSLENLASIGNYVALGSQIALTIASALAPGDATNLLSALFLKLQQIMRYMTIYYSSRLECVLSNTDFQKGFIAYAPDMPIKMLEKLSFPTVSGRFYLYGFTSRFIVNFWVPLLFFGGILVAWVILLIAEKLTKKPDKKYQLHNIARMLRVIVQNFAVAYLYCNYGDILLFIVLELSNTGSNKDLDNLSFALAILFIVINLGMLAGHLYYLVKYQKLKKGALNLQERRKLKQYKKDHEGLQIFSHIFKDTSITHQLFLIVFILKVALIGIFMGCLITSPQVQAILVMCITCVVLIYTIVRRPFNKKIDFVHFLVFDVFFLVIAILLVILSTYDANENPATNSRNTISDILLFSEFGFEGVCLVFLGIKGAIAAKNWRQGKKKYNSKTKSPGLSASGASNTTIDGLIDLENSRNVSQVTGENKPGRGRIDRSDDTMFTTGPNEAASPGGFGRSPRRSIGAIKKRKISTNRLSPGRREKDYETRERGSIDKSTRDNNDLSIISNIEDEDEGRRGSSMKSMSLRRGNTTRSESPGRKDRKVSYADLSLDDGNGGNQRHWNKRTHKKIGGRRESNQRDQRDTSFESNKMEVPREVSFRDQKGGRK